MRFLVIIILTLGMIFSWAKVSNAALMGTAFTYQGHLYDANQAANDIYSFQFGLYDASVDGNQVGGEGTAITRYEELAAATSTGLVVDLVDLNNDRTYTVAVEDLTFSQVAAPDRGEGFGGVVSLTGKIL